MNVARNETGCSRPGRRWYQALVIMLTLGLSLPAVANGLSATLYKNPDCACCDYYADYLRTHGFVVKVIPTDRLTRIQTENGVPQELGGCHTTRIGDYVFEGHIPVESIQRVLAQRPAIKGLSVPGMPAGSPGMGGTRQGPLNVYTIEQDEASRVYATY